MWNRGIIEKLIEVEDKVSKEEAFKLLYLMDSTGLIMNTGGDKLAGHKQPFVRIIISYTIQNVAT